MTRQASWQARPWPAGRTRQASWQASLASSTMETACRSPSDPLLQLIARKASMTYGKPKETILLYPEERRSGKEVYE